ncbi:MAG: response regulator transcription factor [Bacteroidia bacterium]|nr:response regulator transcription factor [Bacteroidia bacterium]
MEITQQEDHQVKIRVILVDDHFVLADGIKALLESVDNISIQGHCPDGKSTMTFLENNPNIDVILLDINLPDISGISLCQQIKKAFPHIKILALTMHQEPGFISRMIRAGANGYLLKNTDRKELVEAILTVERGDEYFGKEVTDLILSGLRPSGSSNTQSMPKITRREKEILHLIIEELTTDEIAEKLFISPSTVISHRKSLLRKLSAKNTAGLVKAAYEYNLLD